MPSGPYLETAATSQPKNRSERARSVQVVSGNSGEKAPRAVTKVTVDRIPRVSYPQIRSETLEYIHVPSKGAYRMLCVWLPR